METTQPSDHDEQMSDYEPIDAGEIIACSVLHGIGSGFVFVPLYYWSNYDEENAFANSVRMGFHAGGVIITSHMFTHLAAFT